MARTIQVRKQEMANLPDTVGRHVGRYSVDMSAETRPTFQAHWLPFGRHACQPILGRQTADTFPTVGPPSTVTSGQLLLLGSIFLFANIKLFSFFQIALVYVASQQRSGLTDTWPTDALNTQDPK